MQDGGTAVVLEKTQLGTAEKPATRRLDRGPQGKLQPLGCLCGWVIRVAVSGLIVYTLSLIHI